MPKPDISQLGYSKQQAENESHDYGLGVHIFSANTPRRTKFVKVTFFAALALLAVVQSVYWLFANSVEPIIMGMPLGMFFLVLCIVLAFFLLLIYFILDER